MVSGRYLTWEPRPPSGVGEPLAEDARERRRARAGVTGRTLPRTDFHNPQSTNTNEATTPKNLHPKRVFNTDEATTPKMLHPRRLFNTDEATTPKIVHQKWNVFFSALTYPNLT